MKDIQRTDLPRVIPSGLIWLVQSAVNNMRTMESYIKAEIKFWESAARICDDEIDRWYQKEAPHPVSATSRIFPRDTHPPT